MAWPWKKDFCKNVPPYLALKTVGKYSPVFFVILVNISLNVCNYSDQTFFTGQ